MNTVTNVHVQQHPGSIATAAVSLTRSATAAATIQHEITILLLYFRSVWGQSVYVVSFAAARTRHGGYRSFKNAFPAFVRGSVYP